MKKYYTILMLVLTSVFTSVAATRTWTGTGSFTTAGNWSGGLVPLTTDHIIIQSGTLTLDANHVVANITMTDGTIDLNSKTLTATGIATFNYGTINNGTMKTNSSTANAIFAGTTFGAVVEVSSGNVYLHG